MHSFTSDLKAFSGIRDSKTNARTENSKSTATQANIGQRQMEDIFTKTRKYLEKNWEHTQHSIIHVREQIFEMIPSQAMDLIYWKNPIQSGIAFSASLSVLITFMSLSALAATAFWLLALLILIAVYKVYNFILANVAGRVQPDIFESYFPPEIGISEAQAQAFANAIQIHGTDLLKQARSLFLWQNLTSSLLYGLILLKFYYLGLLMNALTLTLIGLILTFTAPKIYQIYQVPIDRVIKQILDQINALWAKITSKLPSKPKTN